MENTVNLFLANNAGFKLLIYKPDNPKTEATPTPAIDWFSAYPIGSLSPRPKDE
jgi:hypothetical protein